MNKIFFKILLACFLLTAAPWAHAISLGEWKLVSSSYQDGVGTTKKAFNVCIQQGGDWYISNNDKGWKGRWFERSDGEPSGYSNELILQAIHSRQARMRSIILPFESDIATMPGSLTELSASGEINKGARMLYKGPICELYRDVGAASEQIISPSARPVACLLEVKGKTYIKGVCDFLSLGDGDFMLESSGSDEGYYAAYLNIFEKNKARVSWNEEADSPSAGVPLGEVSRKGACWESATVKLCARGLDAAKLAKIKAAKLAKVEAAKRVQNEISRKLLALQSAVKTMGSRSLKNEFTGPNQCLTLLPGGDVAMSACLFQGAMPAPEQAWYMIEDEDGNHLYMMKNKHANAEQCLEYDSESEKMSMVLCGDNPSPRGLWTAEQQGEHFHFRLPIGTGRDKCLDIINDGVGDKVHMAPCDNYAGQFWN